METAIQIIVAGALLLAWIWVLGRPLVSSQDRSQFDSVYPDHRNDALPTADLSPDGSDLLDLSPSLARRLAERWKAWLYRPSEVWRRQLFLASIFAAIASSLLAIALRTSFQSRFVQLFALMMLGLGIHLIIAVFVGRRMLVASRSEAVAVEKRRVQPAQEMAIRAGQVGLRQSVLEGTVMHEPILHDDDDDADDGLPESAFDLAAELASELEAVEEAAPVDEAAMVSGLIESEWGPDQEELLAETAEPSDATVTRQADVAATDHSDAVATGQPDGAAAELSDAAEPSDGAATGQPDGTAADPSAATVTGQADAMESSGATVTGQADAAAATGQPDGAAADPSGATVNGKADVAAATGQPDGAAADPSAATMTGQADAAAATGQADVAAADPSAATVTGQADGAAADPSDAAVNGKADATGPDGGDVSHGSDESENEAIFRRAAKDEPTRNRRVATPIHIESQLDDPGDFPEAKAVNHP